MYRLYAYICFMWSNVCTDIDIRLINLSLRTRTTRNDDKWRAAMKRKRSPSQYLHSIRTYALIIIPLAVGSALVWHYVAARTPTLWSIRYFDPT